MKERLVNANVAMRLARRFGIEIDETVPPIEGRPDLVDPAFGVTRLTRFPPYVYSSSGNGALVHRVAYVEASWYTCHASHGHLLHRLLRPMLTVYTACRTMKHPRKSAAMCLLPRHVCAGESGGEFIGVYALTSGPMSVAYCDNCASEGCEPSFALDYLFVFVAGGDLTRLCTTACSACGHGSTARLRRLR